MYCTIAHCCNQFSGEGRREGEKGERGREREQKVEQRDKENGKFGKEKCVSMFNVYTFGQEGDREMAQWARVLADLPEDPSPVTNTHVKTLIVAFSSKGSNASGLRGHLHLDAQPPHKYV